MELLAGVVGSNEYIDVAPLLDLGDDSIDVTENDLELCVSGLYWCSYSLEETRGVGLYHRGAPALITRARTRRRKRGANL
jgi:hypothetical protein